MHGLHTCGVPSPWTTFISCQPGYVLVKHTVLRAMLNTFGNRNSINTPPTHTIVLLPQQRNISVLKSSREKPRTDHCTHLSPVSDDIPLLTCHLQTLEVVYTYCISGFFNFLKKKKTHFTDKENCKSF